ncbi:hypothetical protein ACPEH1_16960 [Stenotrophomonas sp. NPDC077421]|uniref:hypothetical protein n=1 Tax=Stenotrophomonas sp. NPDC077421 TaxID=3414699 RepID=UPI0013108857
MRERPILFNGDMVRAILAGQKTQARRAMKVQPRRNGPFWEVFGAGWGSGVCRVPAVPGHSLAAHCPFGQPGDRLWLRETTVNVEDHGYIGPVYAESDEGRAILNYGLAPVPDDCIEVEPDELRLRPSIHMPRSMCRLVLEITAVRVERLQAISVQDCLAEGITTRFKVADAADDLRIQFRDLWTSTGGDWDCNPWVWVLEFKKIQI